METESAALCFPAHHTIVLVTASALPACGALVAAYNADVEARTRRITNADGSVTVIRPRTPFNQIINPIALPAVFSNGDSFMSQDLRLTRKIALKESLTLSLIG